jgi:hypothetical protein
LPPDGPLTRLGDQIPNLGIQDAARAPDWLITPGHRCLISRTFMLTVTWATTSASANSFQKLLQLFDENELVHVFRQPLPIRVARNDVERLIGMPATPCLQCGTGERVGELDLLVVLFEDLLCVRPLFYPTNGAPLSLNWKRSTPNRPTTQQD